MKKRCNISKVLDCSEPRLVLYSSFISHFRSYLEKKSQNECLNEEKKQISSKKQSSSLGRLGNLFCSLAVVLEDRWCEGDRRIIFDMLVHNSHPHYRYMPLPRRQAPYSGNSFVYASIMIESYFPPGYGLHRFLIKYHIFGFPSTFWAFWPKYFGLVRNIPGSSFL